jgi:hypothetical protein
LIFSAVDSPLMLLLSAVAVVLLLLLLCVAARLVALCPFVGSSLLTVPQSFRPIIELEYQRWQTTDAAQGEKLNKLLKQRAAKGKGDSKLTLDEWIIAVSSWGVPPDQVAKITGQPIPLNLYYEIASRQEKMVRATPAQLYATAHLPETKSLYYADHKAYEFNGKVSSQISLPKQHAASCGVFFPMLIFAVAACVLFFSSDSRSDAQRG